ncbi:hypothetical protein [Streptomyces sp. NBC_01481]|uniref:hypothetical protein n=1 Tax=Streptomyces sp. NBC_01481 TaxID=2975869 RepID=UPI002B1CCFAF|nr:hypothetical protein [Streptomyces sp. NBC_01481]
MSSRDLRPPPNIHSGPLLAQDPDENVRFVVATRPDLTEEQRAGIYVDFDLRGHCSQLDWVMALHDDPDAMRRLAASSHPLVRRSVRNFE